MISSAEESQGRLHRIGNILSTILKEQLEFGGKNVEEGIGQVILHFES